MTSDTSTWRQPLQSVAEQNTEKVEGLLLFRDYNVFFGDYFMAKKWSALLFQVGFPWSQALKYFLDACKTQSWDGLSFWWKGPCCLSQVCHDTRVISRSDPSAYRSAMRCIVSKTDAPMNQPETKKTQSGAVGRAANYFASSGGTVGCQWAASGPPGLLLEKSLG